MMERERVVLRRGECQRQSTAALLGDGIASIPGFGLVRRSFLRPPVGGREPGFGALFQRPADVPCLRRLHLGVDGGHRRRGRRRSAVGMGKRLPVRARGARRMGTGGRSAAGAGVGRSRSCEVGGGEGSLLLGRGGLVACPSCDG
jgi:hypothetical protein